MAGKVKGGGAKPPQPEHPVVYASNAMEQELALTYEQRLAQDLEVLEWMKERFDGYWLHTPTTSWVPGPRHPLFHLTLDVDK